MFEGKELEGEITVNGEKLGGYSVDLDDSGMISGDVMAEKTKEVMFPGGVVGGNIKANVYLKVEAMPLLKKIAAKLPILGRFFAESGN